MVIKMCWKNSYTDICCTVINDFTSKETDKLKIKITTII